LGSFVKGDVVVVKFPFTDLSGSKKRPALVVAGLSGDDSILCMITSQYHRDGHSVDILDGDFSTGSINHDSVARPNKLFTAEDSIIDRKAGSLEEPKIKEVEQVLVSLFTN